jgi:hypothetical protein
VQVAVCTCLSVLLSPQLWKGLTLGLAGFAPTAFWLSVFWDCAYLLFMHKFEVQLKFT